MRILSIAAACLFVLAAVSNFVYGAAGSSSGADPVLVGRVVDVSGQPIANARVVASPLTEMPMRQALRVETYSNADGLYRFDTALKDIDYSLGFWASGYTHRNVSSRSGSVPTTVLERNPVHRVSGTVRLQSTGGPAVGARVILIGEKEYVAEVVTADDGRFEFADAPDNLGQGVLYAYHEDQISPYVMVRRGRMGADLTLTDSAFIQGRCVAEGSNEPLSRCHVIARPRFASGFSLETETDDHGEYRFGPVPLGVYVIHAQHSQWFQPPTRGDFLEPERIRMISGVNSVWDIAMRQKSRIEGVVLGPDGSPVPDAIVAAPSAVGQVYALERTDARGRFVLFTHALDPSLRSRSVEIAAFSDRLGAGAARLAATEESASVYDGVVIRLGGRMRIQGHVTDSQGTPLSDISVSIYPHSGPIRRTDASGCYDLEWFPLPSDANAPIIVNFRAPRPHDGNMNVLLPAPERKPARLPDPNMVHVLHTAVAVSPRHNGTEIVNVVLPRTDLLTFSGTVTDALGSPVSQAQIMLFAGNAEPEDWLIRMDPDRLGNGWVIPGWQAYAALARTVSDDRGRFTICVARESRQSLEIAYFRANIDPSLFSLGVEALDGTHRLASDLRIGDNETSKRVEIRLP